MAAAPPAAEPAATRGYPSLRTVPPRPRLSYPVEQRREIVEGLISDRENARYTDQEVRYRTGRSDVPPPAVRPDPLVGAAAEIDALVGPAAPVVPEGVLPVDEEEEFATVRRSGLGGDDLDDDSLGDFIREMVRETRPGGRDDVDLEPLPPPARAAGPQPQPGVVEPEGEAAPQASRGGFTNWLGGLLSGRAAASEEAETTPEVEQAEEEEVPAGSPAPEPEALEPETAPAPSATGPAVQPAPSPRKPTIVERPPEPSPVKPEPGPSGSHLEEVRVPS